MFLQFLQVVQGRVASPQQVRTALDRWVAELSPAATGWLGSTVGVTEGGLLIATVRFTSEENARRNSTRPGQDAWWAETSKLFTGEVTFHDCQEVVLLGRGAATTPGSSRSFRAGRTTLRGCASWLGRSSR